MGGVGSRSGLEPNPRGGGRIQNWSGPVQNRTGRNLLFLLLLFRHHRFQTGFRINPPSLLVPTGSEPPKLGAGLGSHSERNRSDSKPENSQASSPASPGGWGSGFKSDRPALKQVGRTGGLAPTQDAMCV